MSGAELTHRFYSIALVVLVAAGAIACNAEVTPTASPPAFFFSPCPEQVPDEEPPEAPEPTLAANGLFHHCGQLTIERTPGWMRTIQVAVVSNRATDPLQQRNVLVYHPGGPGIGAVSELLRSPPEIDFNEHAVLTWDGATSGDGTGACGQETIRFLTERTPGDYSDLGLAAGNECQGGFGSAVDVGAWAAADELETIRAALGIESFDLITMSYGTAVAEAYLRWHPERVRRAVLDAPIGLDVPWAERVAAVGSISATLADELAAACATDRCSALLGDVASDQSYESLRAAVLAAEPSVGSGSLRLAPVMLDQATLLALHSQDHWNGWASAIDEALAGDGSSLWGAGARTFLDLDRQVYYRSLCADIDRPSDASGYAGGQDPLFFAYASELTPCVSFPTGTPPQDLAALDAPRPDTRIYVSTRDALAPAPMLTGAQFLSGLGRFCVSDHTGHTSYADEGSREAMLTFLESGQSNC